MPSDHLYRGKGTKARKTKEFQGRYGAKKGKYVYGATVGKVRRERLANKKKKKK